MKKAVFYIRASTDKTKQKNSFDVQLAILTNFATQHGYDVVQVFQEYQSGKSCDSRPAFIEAINHVKKTGDHLIAYRCDRLGRGLDVFEHLKDIIHLVRAVEVGDRQIDSLMLSVLFGLATRESEVISLRVKAGIARAIERNPNRQTGNPRIRETAIPAGLKVRRANAAKLNDRIKEIVQSFTSRDAMTYKGIAGQLNMFGIKTRRGSSWTASSIHRVLNHCPTES